MGQPSRVLPAQYSPEPEGAEEDNDEEGGGETPQGPGGERAVSFVEQPGGNKSHRGVSSRGKSIVDRINNGSPPSPVNNGSGSAGGVWPGKTELSAGGASLQRSGSGMRMAELISQIDDLRSETDTLRELVEELQTGVAQVKGDAAKGDEALGLRVSALETASVQMRENLMQEIAAVKNKEKAREGEVSFADFSALSSKVESTAAEVAAATSGLAELREQQVAPLKEQLSDLKDQVRAAWGACSCGVWPRSGRRRRGQGGGSEWARREQAQGGARRCPVPPLISPSPDAPMLRAVQEGA